MITNIIYVVVGCISYTTSFALLVHFLKMVPKRLDKVMEEAKKPFITEEEPFAIWMLSSHWPGTYESPKGAESPRITGRVSSSIWV